MARAIKIYGSKESLDEFLSNLQDDGEFCQGDLSVELIEDGIPTGDGIFVDVGS